MTDWYNKFKAELILRWLTGKCPFWALNAQFHINPKEKTTP